jgi:hypothetical protein
MQGHQSAAWLDAFLVAVRASDLYAPPQVVKGVLARYEKREQTGNDLPASPGRL